MMIFFVFGFAFAEATAFSFRSAKSEAADVSRFPTFSLVPVTTPLVDEDMIPCLSRWFIPLSSA